MPNKETLPSAITPIKQPALGACLQLCSATAGSSTGAETAPWNVLLTCPSAHCRLTNASVHFSCRENHFSCAAEHSHGRKLPGWGQRFQMHCSCRPWAHVHAAASAGRSCPQMWLVERLRGRLSRGWGAKSACTMRADPAYTAGTRLSLTAGRERHIREHQASRCGCVRYLQCWRCGHDW